VNKMRFCQIVREESFDIHQMAISSLTAINGHRAHKPT
jgi:hypothetical protein